MIECNDDLMTDRAILLGILAEIRRLNENLERIETDVRAVKINPSNPLVKLFLRS